MKKQEMAKKMGTSTQHTGKDCGYKCVFHTKAFSNANTRNKKGKQSLNSVGKNEGEKHYLGKDEEPVA